MTEDFQLRTSRDSFLALRCGACGTVFLSLVPTAAALGRIFPPGYRANPAPPWPLPPAGSRVLDLGPWVAPDQLRRLALDGEYDLARLDFTVECAADPVGLLQTVRAALRPGGRALVRLNNLTSPAFALFGGRHWGGYDTPRQQRVLSREGLARLASLAAMELDEVISVPTGEPWIRSIHRWCRDWGAPDWLASRFSDRARLSRRVFRLVDEVFRASGRCAIALATLRRRETEASP
jgi:SAM-dependent methyltransferase